jgi:hypothetical protein
MVRINIDDALNLMHQGEREFKFLVELNIITKAQMFITGKIHKGVEIYGIGPQEIHGFGFMIRYGKEINTAVSLHYRVFLKKEGKYFGNGNWYLEFFKNP